MSASFFYLHLKQLLCGWYWTSEILFLFLLPPQLLCRTSTLHHSLFIHGCVHHKKVKQKKKSTLLFSISLSQVLIPIFLFFSPSLFLILLYQFISLSSCHPQSVYCAVFSLFLKGKLGTPPTATSLSPINCRLVPVTVWFKLLAGTVKAYTDFISNLLFELNLKHCSHHMNTISGLPEKCKRTSNLNIT